MAVRPPSIDTSNDPALTSGATSPTVASTQATINPDGTLARISNVPLTATTVVSNTSFVVTGNTTTVDSGDNVVVVTTDKDVFITVNEDNFAQNFINNDVNNIGGSEGEVQYNKDGNFAGDSTFTFNDTTKVLSVDGVSTDTLLYANGEPWVFSGTTPGAPNNSIQFNDSGIFNGVPGVTYANGNFNLGNVSAVTLNGGSSGQVLTTNGNGVLSWSTPAGSYSNSNVAAYLPTYTGNVGASNVNVTGTVYANGLSATGLAALTILNVSTTANLGAVGNITITGGSNGQVLQTNGNGGLSWASATGANANYANFANVAEFANTVYVEAVNNNFSYHVVLTTGPGDTTLHNDVDESFQYNPQDGILTVTRVDSQFLEVTNSVLTNLVPFDSLPLNLGSNTNRWQDLYLSNSTIYLGDATISANGNSIVVDSITTTGNVSAGNVNLSGNIIGSSTIEIDNRASGNGADINLYSADDITIQARDRATGSTSEGGDINIFAGDSAEDSDTSGGDVIIEAGNGGASNIDFGGSGGFIRIEAGDGGAASTEANGFSALSGGQLTLNAGDGGTNNGNVSRGASGGDVSINAGDSTGSGQMGGDIFLTTGLGGGNALAGRVQIITPSSATANGGTWTFDGEGNLTLPGNTFAVNYANGTQVPLGGGGSTGNVTFDDVTVQGDNTQLNLSAGADFTANLAYLQVRAGDVASHIHFDTGNSQAYDLIVGNDDKYVQVSSTGNIIMSSYDGNTSYIMTLDNTGDLILAGGSSIIRSVANSSLDPINPNVSTMVLIPDAGYISQSLVLDPTAPGHIHLRAPGANIDEPYANIFLGGEDSSFEVGYYNGSAPNVFIHSGGNTWEFLNDGNLVLPRDAVGNTDPFLRITGGASPRILSEDVSLAGPANLEITALNTIFTGSSGSAIKIYADDGEIGSTANLQIWTNSGGNTEYSWTFGNDGVLTLPQGSQISETANTSVNITANTNTWAFGVDGNLTLPGDLVAISASPAPVIRGFSSVSALQFTNGNSNVTINANSNTWTFDSTGNLIIPGASGGFIKTVANASIGVAAVDNGTNNPAQLLSMTNAGAATSIVSAYATNATIQTNATGSINTWAFDSTGNLTLPGNTFAVNYANGTQVSLGGGGVAEASFSIQSSNFNATAGSRYGVNTSGGAVTATLPASPATGAAIFFADAGGAYASNNLTIARNGQTIMGAASDLTVSTNNQSVGLFFNGTTWRIYNAG